MQQGFICASAGRRRGAGVSGFAVGMTLCLVLASAGCPNGSGDTPPPDNNNTNSSGGSLDDVTGAIVAPSSNQQLSSLEMFTSVIYTVESAPTDASVSGFYVPVSSNNPDATPIDDRVIIAQNLPQGVNQAFNYDPQVSGPGNFKVGIVVALGDDEREFVSTGIITVEGPPNPRFIQPADTRTTVVQGDEVFISFDAGDPENDVQWRLFLLSQTDSADKPADQLGQELSFGAGNVGSFTVITDSLAPGEYDIGLSATDSGHSIATTVERGEEEQIVTIPIESTPPLERRVIVVTEPGSSPPPSLAFTAPASDVNLFGDQTFTIVFAVDAVTDATGEVEVYLDLDTSPTNGFFRTIESGLPFSATSVVFPNDVEEDTYNVCATVRQQSTAPVTECANGTITVVRTPTLVVTAPNTALPVRPGETVGVAWSTNVPSTAGLVDVFAQRLDVDGQPLNEPEIQLLPPSNPAINSADFNQDKSGIYQVSVRLTLNDRTISTPPCVQGICIASAPQPVRVTTVPGILWLGSLADSNPTFEGAIFEGVNFEDNAGTAFSAVNDLNDDGLGEILISSRYGKPFFDNPSGVGPGEAYLIYGAAGAGKITGSNNLNSVGSGIRGITLSGIRTPQGSSVTDGMSTVSRLPDVDGDNKDELVFGFPRTESRGHNISPLQDGFIDPRALATLEREDQFLRGGIVIVSSRNSQLQDPGDVSEAINLDLVGQDFDLTCVDPEPDDALPNDVADFFVDARSDIDDDDPTQSCTGSCDDPESGGKPDATEYIDFGFAAALARDYFQTYVYSWEFWGGTRFCDSVDQFIDHECLLGSQGFVFPHQYCAPFTAACEPFSPGLHADVRDPDGDFDFIGFPTFTRHSGYYSTFLADEDNNILGNNQPVEPLGARILGVGLDDRFGTSLTLSNATGTGAGDVIVTAPSRTARGILFGPFPSGCSSPPECGGEIDGLESSPGVPKTTDNSGVAYIFSLRSLWTNDASGRIPPKPHQYIVGEPSHCDSPAAATIENIEATRISGLSGDKISNLVGIDDFNNDGLDDFAIGAAAANDGQGRVYIAFRRGSGLEGDFVLEKLARAPNDPERLTGVLINTATVDGLGASLATGVDFNGDGISDLVVGSPDASNGRGEVIVVFGDPNLRSELDGISVQELLTTRDLQGMPRAARITGNALDTDGQFGFNVTNAGDIDGDGTNDLLIAAPNASPRFDADPSDDSDELTTTGIDIVPPFGEKDDVSGPEFLPDGAVDGFDDLENAGLVYVIFGSNRLDEVSTCTESGKACQSDDDCDASANDTCDNQDVTINVSQLGTEQLAGFMIIGRRTGDRIGGGDAGETLLGGIQEKKGRGRSKGLASAGDFDGDGRADILIGSVLADPRRDPNTGTGIQNAGEAYLIYGSVTNTMP